MTLRIPHAVPAVVVAVALGASTTLLVVSTSGGAGNAKPPAEATSTCKPAPARCGSEDNDLVIAAANEAARRMHELETTGSTTVTNPAP
jgi:hypothetical protein